MANAISNRSVCTSDTLESVTLCMLTCVCIEVGDLLLQGFFSGGEGRGVKLRGSWVNSFSEVTEGRW